MHLFPEAWYNEDVQGKGHFYLPTNYRYSEMSFSLNKKLANRIAVVCLRDIGMKKENFWEWVDFTAPNGCWNWLRYKTPKGYGRLGRKGKMFSAHRYAWELVNSSIPKGLFVLHHCDNPSCVNPFHLYLGTHQDNMRDMRLRNRSLKGSDRPTAKLVEKQVLEMRKLHKKGKMNYIELGKMFGISDRYAADIIKRKNWKHV